MNRSEALQQAPEPFEDPVSLDAARQQFDAWARDTLFEPAHRRGTEILDLAVDAHLIGLYRALELHQHLQAGHTSAELSEMLQFEDSAWIALDAMLKRLADRHDFVRAVETDGTLTFHALSQPDDRSGILPGLRDEDRQGPRAPRHAHEVARRRGVRLHQQVGAHHL